MAWHEILAWGIIAVAFVVAAAWCIRRIMCPTTKCNDCNKECRYRKDNN